LHYKAKPFTPCHTHSTSGMPIVFKDKLLSLYLHPAECFSKCKFYIVCRLLFVVIFPSIYSSD
jgi:hypothetical protein